MGGYASATGPSAVSMPAISVVLVVRKGSTKAARNVVDARVCIPKRLDFTLIHSATPTL
jgi:hypothetical protein